MKEDPQAYNAYTKLVSTCRVAKNNYLAMGELLSELKTGDKFKDAVGDTETWNQFLKQPEIGLSIGEADKLIKIYNRLVLDNSIEITKLENISLKNLKKLSDQETITGELVDMAMTLSDQDFREVIAENSGIMERTYTYMIMKKCKETGSMTKVHGYSNEDVDTMMQMFDNRNK